jgi:hypothetical protein
LYNDINIKDISYIINMNSTTTTDNKENAYHTFTNMEFTGVVIKWELQNHTIKTYMSDYHLFIKYGDKVYVDVFMVGEVVISFDELQKNDYLKHYYDLSLMFSKNKNIVFQKPKYTNVEPYIYREDRFWGFDSAYIDAPYNDIIMNSLKHTHNVVDNDDSYYYKINPYDLENMEYSSQEVLDDFHKKNKVRKMDMGFNYTANTYLRLAFDYYMHRKETEYDNLIADYYIQIIERDVRKVFFEDKENVINLTTLIEKKGLDGDILNKLHSYIDSAKKRYSGIIDTIEDCKSKLEKNIQMLE